VAAGITPDRPAIVVRANRVIARTPAAAAAGITAGARRRAAQGACPDVLVLEHDPDRDARAFEPVVRAVAEMAPRLEVVEPGWICLAARGPSRYFGGDASMAALMVRVVAECVGQSVCIGVGVAEGRTASAIAARRASRTADGVFIVPVGEAGGFVAGQSVGWLRELGEIDAEMIDLFARLGVTKMGQLAALDRGDVLARFGAEGAHAHRLASATDDRPAAATDPPPERWVEHPFAEPIEQLDTVVFVAKRLADQLAAELAAEGRVCVRLVVIVETEHGERSERAWYRDRGFAAAAMVERVRWQLEGWVQQPGGLSGGVSLVRLLPEEMRSDDGVQTAIWGGRSQADDDATRAIVRLSAIAGEDAVTVPAWVGGRLPIERYRWIPAATADLDDPGDRLDIGDGVWPGALPVPSPAMVLELPVQIEVFDEVGRSVRVSGRGEISAEPSTLVMMDGRRGVVAWAGPWPVEQRWWSTGRSRRIARFQMVTDDGVAHLVGVEQQRWVVLATYA
jgi:protein ImuB